MTLQISTQDTGEILLTVNCADIKVDKKHRHFCCAVHAANTW